MMSESNLTRSHPFPPLSVHHSWLLAKSFLRLFLPPALAVGGILLVIHMMEVRSRERILRGDERQTVTLQSSALRHGLRAIGTHPLVLSAHHDLRLYVETGSEAARRNFAEEVRSFCSVAGGYDQVRLLDGSGQERVRVERRDGTCTIVPDRELQSKGDRYYFRETLRTPRGEVYVSPLDLNVEWGKPETPPKPVLRLGVPLFDSDERPWGILVLNYLGSELLGDFEEAAHRRAGQSLLLDSEGRSLWTRTPGNAWTSLAREVAGADFPDAFPAAWERISAAEEGQFAGPDGLFTFTTEYPVREVNGWAERSRGKGGGAGSSDRPWGYHWKVVSRVSPAELLAGRRESREVLWRVYAALAVILAVGSWIMAAAIVRRRVAEKALAEAADDLRRSQARVYTIMNNAAVGIVTVGRDGTIESLNPAVEKLFGYPANEIVGRDISLLVPDLGPDTDQPRDEQLARLNARLGPAHETRGRRRDGSTFPLEATVNEVGLGGPDHAFALVFRDVTERHRAEMERQRLFTAVEQTRDAVVVTDADGTIRYVNPAFRTITGYSRAEAVGRNPRLLQSGVHGKDFYRELWATILSGRTWSGRFTNRRKDGTLYHEEATISPVRDESEAITNFVAVKRDISEEVRMESQLQQSQKLEAIGQLAAGIAHEINTPTQYVGDNTRFLQDAFGELVPVIEQTSALLTSLAEGSVSPEQVDEVSSAIEEADLDYLHEEIPRAIRESLDGVARVTEIVAAMKEFSHPGGEEKKAIDINRAIQSTITVARNEWKYVAELETDLDPDLPPVPCLPGEFNQVILNMIVNAAHAIADILEEGSEEKGKIRISTRLAGDMVEIRIADTGAGIPERARDRIFDPFFTTKAVGKGTGQGLSIAHGVVVHKHGGTISFETELGKGTTFVVQLPLVPPEEPAETEEATA